MADIEKIKSGIPDEHIIAFLLSNCAKCKYCPGVKNVDEISSEAVCNYAHDPMIISKGNVKISLNALQSLSTAKKALDDGSAKVKLTTSWSCMDMVERDAKPIVSQNP